MNIFLFGISGKMGKTIVELAKEYNVNITGGFDIVPSQNIPTFSSIDAINVPIDVIVDFSRPETLNSVIALAQKLHAPSVLATTGYSVAQQQQIDDLSKTLPVFQSANMSVGINIMNKLIAEATKLLASTCDIEIVEKHHNQKVDAPSGTAKMFANTISKNLEQAPNFVNGREGVCPRKKNDIGIHSIRGGTIVGDHEVIYCGQDEVITISHSAYSRKILASGAINAAKFLQTKLAGKYNMDDMLNL